MNVLELKLKVKEALLRKLLFLTPSSTMLWSLAHTPHPPSPSFKNKLVHFNIYRLFKLHFM